MCRRKYRGFWFWLSLHVLLFCSVATWANAETQGQPASSPPSDSSLSMQPADPLTALLQMSETLTLRLYERRQQSSQLSRISQTLDQQSALSRQIGSDETRQIGQLRTQLQSSQDKLATSDQALTEIMNFLGLSKSDLQDLPASLSRLNLVTEQEVRAKDREIAELRVALLAAAALGLGGILYGILK